MKKQFTACLFTTLLLFLSNFSFGQFRAVPNFPDEYGTVVLTYDATNTGLQGVENVFIYAQAIDETNGTYQKAAWNDVPTTAGLAATRNGNIYTVTITNINAFFNVGASKKVRSVQVLFRNSDGSTNSGDLFFSVSNADNNTNPLISISPANPNGTEPVVVTFNKQAGNRAMASFNGPIYAYAFVQQYFGPGGEYAKSGWGDEDLNPQLALTSVTGNANLWTLTINGIRSFYGIPTTARVSELKFIFKNAPNDIFARDVFDKDVRVAVNLKASQGDINFPSLVNTTVPSGTIQTIALNATVPSGLTVSYSVASMPMGIAMISGNSLTLSGGGMVTVTGIQAGNDSYEAATSVSRTFQATGDQTLTFPPISTVAIIGGTGSQVVTLAGSASSSLPVSYTVSSTPNNIATYAGNFITVTGAGTVTVSGIQLGNATFFATPAIVRTFAVTTTTSPQLITFPEVANATLAGASLFGVVTLNATSNSLLPVSYLVASTPNNIAVGSGSSITITGAGTVTVTASQIGNGAFSPASDVIRTFVVSTVPSAQLITFPTIAGVVVVEGSAGKVVALSATSSSTLPVSYSVASTPNNIAVGSGSSITITGAGTVTVTASQVGNGVYGAAANVIQTFSARSVPPLYVANPALPEANGGVVVTFSMEAQSKPELINASNNLFVYAFVKYTLGTVTGTTDKAPWGEVGNTPDLQLTKSVSNSNIYTLTIPNIRAFFPVLQNPARVNELVLIVRNGAGTVQTDNLSINISATNNTIAGPSNQLITFGSIATQTVSGKNITAVPLSASASSGLAVTYTLATSPANIATIAGSVLSINAPGTVTVTANQLGNSDFKVAPSVSRSFSVVTIAGALPRGLVSTDPAIPSLDAPFVIYFNADVTDSKTGNGLKTITGDVFIYSGITTPAGSFNYILAAWPDVSASAKSKMTKVVGEPNLYALTVTGGLRAFYGIPATVPGANLLAVDIIFRNGAGTVQTNDLKIALSSITSVQEALASTSAISVYPNPNNGSFIVDVENGGTYSLYSVDGKAVASGSLSAGANSLQHNLSKGLYILKIGASFTRVVVE